MTSAMPVQCSNQLSYEVTQLRAGQFVGLMFSRERNVVWKMCYMKCGVWNHLISNTFDFDLVWKMCYMKCGVWNHLISNTFDFDFKHRTSYNTSFILHSFHGKTWAQQILQPCDFIAQLVRALHRHRRGHGLESRWVTWIFQVHETIA